MQSPPALPRELSVLTRMHICFPMSLQDMPALSSLLVGQLAKGALVSDKIMCRSLEVFQKYGDHRYEGERAQYERFVTSQQYVTLAWTAWRWSSSPSI